MTRDEHQAAALRLARQMIAGGPTGDDWFSFAATSCEDAIGVAAEMGALYIGALFELLEALGEGDPQGVALVHVERLLAVHILADVTDTP